jgi:eukaryotic-like serine/threonine-protein kinase
MSQLKEEAMREPPPAQLTALLHRLHLATDQDLQSVEGTVNRIAGGLPQFESVWIDALRQARFLTHFQAAELHAGRGEGLAIERYVICHSVHECGYTAIYKAEDRQSRDPVRLATFSVRNEDQDLLLARINQLIAIGKGLQDSAGIITSAGMGTACCWASSPWVDGTSLADFVLRHGRLAPEVVLEIARAMIRELAALEAASLVHGDIRVQNVLMTRDGEIFIPHPGLRGVIRPHEGVAHLDLVPDACSALAPERVTDGTPPTVASDLFACGCVWWHILCGRPPLGGGDTLARLRAAQAAAIDDLHQWVADVPDVLVEVIHDCLQRDPRKRPKSMADLARRLGPLRRNGRQAIVRCQIASSRPHAPWLRTKRSHSKKPANPHRFTAAALALIATVAIIWPLWAAHNKPRANALVASNSEATAARPAPSRIETAGQEARREPAHRRFMDSAVSPAGYIDAAAPPHTITSAGHDSDHAKRPGSLPHDAREELRLPIDRPVRGDLLQLKPRQWVHAEGGRSRMIVPRAGLAVPVDRVLFENVDFVTQEQPDLRAVHDEASPALIRLMAAECDFVGCSFQSAAGSPELSAAIVWQHASANRPETAALPAGRVRMKNCVFRRVAVGLESYSHGTIDLDIVNALHLGPGPMIRLTHVPAADEPVGIHLTQVTLREADALIDCRCASFDGHPGEIGIEASGCVLAPRAQSALLILSSDNFPGAVLHEVKWTGQGSVVAGQVVFGRWRRGDGAWQTIDDATVSISGLVRGEVEFAGKLDGNPASCQVLNCQAPLQESDSAGAAVGNLPPEIAPGSR